MVEIRNIVITVCDGAREVESYRFPMTLRGDLFNARHDVHERAKKFPFFRGSSVDSNANEIILSVHMECSAFDAQARRWVGIMATQEELEGFVNDMAENVAEVSHEV